MLLCNCYSRIVTIPVHEVLVESLYSVFDRYICGIELTKWTFKRSSGLGSRAKQSTLGVPLSTQGKKLVLPISVLGVTLPWIRIPSK